MKTHFTLICFCNSPGSGFWIIIPTNYRKLWVFRDGEQLRNPNHLGIRNGYTHAITKFTAEFSEKGDRETLRSLVEYIFKIELIHYLYGHEFIGAQRVLQIIFAASIFSNLSNPAAAVLYGFEKQAFIYRYGIILAVVNIVIDLILIKPYGAIGAAICYGVTTVLGSVGGLIYTCKLMGLQYPFFSVLKILFSSVIMGVAMESILYVNQEIPGFILSIITGAAVFFASTLILGSFEEEDVALIEHVRDLFPRQTKPLINLFISIGKKKKRTVPKPSTVKRYVKPFHHSQK